MDSRFVRLWDQWRDRLAKGATMVQLLSECSDETLVELLAVPNEGSAVERNVIATELTNRISRLHRNVAGHSATVRGLVDENAQHLASARDADERIRAEADTIESETDRTSRYSEKRRREGGW